MRLVTTSTLVALAFAFTTLGASRHAQTIKATTTPKPLATTAPATTAPVSQIQPLSVAGSGCTLSLTMPPSCTPYSANSPFNRTVAQQNSGVSPSSATWQAYYRSTTQFFNHLSFGYTNQVNQWQHPIYISTTTSDPSHNVSCVFTWFTCPTNWLHVPSYARPAGGGDEHMGMIDLNEGDPTHGFIEMDSWLVTNFPPNGGTIATGESGKLQTTDEGIGGAATGAGFALWAGVVRAPEIANSTPQVLHALFIVAPCTSNVTVYPSNYRNSSDTTCPNGQGAPYGAYGRLNMTHAQIDALGIPGADEKALVYALADYGGYLGDTNGNNGFQIQVEADPTYSLSGSGYTFMGTGCPSNGSPCTPLTAFENHWGNPDWAGDRYTIDLTKHVDFANKWVWLNPPTPR